MKVDEREIDRVEAIILSMTPEERRRPELIKGSRRLRIAKGSGTSVQQVNQLVKQFDQMRKLMRQIGRGKMPDLGALDAAGPLNACRRPLKLRKAFMAVRLRLTRVGGKKDPIWRVVVADQRSPRDGRFIETVGPVQPADAALDDRRSTRTASASGCRKGAQPTAQVRKLLKTQGIDAAAR